MKHAILIGAALLLTACQTTSGTDTLVEKYTTAVTCVRAHVDQQLTPARETPDKIGQLVRSGLNACEAPMKDYIRYVEYRTMQEKRWSSLQAESKRNITRNVVATTSIALQKEYNTKEQGQ